MYPSSAFRHKTQFQDVDHVEVNDIKYFAVFVIGYRNTEKQERHFKLTCDNFD